jgi:SAM-dependent methyltransferase
LIENDESEQDLTYIEFGSGTGRTIDYLRALPHITDRVVYFVGLDNSEQMVGRARQKRDGALAAGHDKTFYFLLDAADATRNFGNGRIHLTSDLNDQKQVSSHGLEPERYESTRRLICCLLNTVGIVRGDLRERMVASMFACAHADDTVVISVFSGEAFEKHAFPLYRDIQPLVGTDVVPGEFSNDTQTFSAGNYYSQWLWIDDVRSLIERSGGVVVDVRDIEDGNREHLGRFFVCERRVEEPKVAS